MTNRPFHPECYLPAQQGQIQRISAEAAAAARIRRRPTVHLYQRGSVWWMSCRESGKRVRRSLFTKDRAQAERLVSCEVALPPVSGSVHEALAAYKAYAVVRRSPWTNKTMFGHLRRVLADTAAVNVQDITAPRVQDYLTTKAVRGLAPRTLNHIRAELHVFCRWLVDRQELPANPIDRVRAWRVPAPTIRYLGHGDIVAMRAAVEGDPVEPIALCMLWAGLRRSEAIWLQWEDIDLVRGLLAIRGKPGWQPKTRRNRTLPLSPKLRAMLEGLPRRHPWVFCAPRGQRWYPDKLSERFRGIMREAGLPWILLDLRRTFGSHLIQRPGMTYAKLAALMGNNAAICARHYAHLATEGISAEELAF